MDLGNRRRRSLALLAAALFVVGVAGIAVLGPEFRTMPEGADAAREPEGATNSAALEEGMGTTLHGRAVKEESRKPRPISTEAVARAVEDLVIVGRVLDARHAAVAQASVRVARSDAGAVDVTTGADGRFSARTGPHPTQTVIVTIHARAAERGAALRALDVLAGDRPRQDVGSLVLAPAHDVTVHVALDGASIANVEVFVSPASRGYVSIGTTGSAGLVRGAAIPEGTLRFVALAPGPLWGEARGEVPVAGDAPIELALRAARDVKVHVVEQETETPVAGAAIHVLVTDAIHQDWDTELRMTDPGTPSWPVWPAPTDAEGRTVIRGVPKEETLSVFATGAGWVAPSAHGDGAKADPSTDEVLIEVPRARELRFPIGPGDGDPPADGTRVRLAVDETAAPEFRRSGDLPSAEARVDGDVLVVPGYRGGQFLATARLPDGRVGRAAVRMSDASKALAPVSFRRPRSVVVRVADEDGLPAGGVGVRLSWSRQPLPSTDARVTGPDGVARFDDLPPNVYSVTVNPSAALVHPDQRIARLGPVLACVDLSTGSAAVDLVVPREREAIVRVLVDGRPGLVEGERLSIISFGDGMEAREPPGVVYDVANGEIRFRARPRVPVERNGDDLDLRLRAPGYPDVWSRFAVPPTSGPWVVTVERRSTGVIDLEWTAPPSSPSPWWGLEEWIDGSWRALANTGGAIPGRLDALRFDRLGAGRFRFVEQGSRVATEPIVLPSETGPAVASVDLSRRVEAVGRIEAPVDADVWNAVLMEEGPGLDPGSVDVRVGGEFHVTLPGDRPVTLRLTHPTLYPAPGSESVTWTTAPDRPVSLRLVEGPVISFRVDPAPEKGYRIRVAFRPSADDAAPWREREVVGTQGLVRVGVPGAGIYDVVVDPRLFPPRSLAGVRVLEAGADLGTLSFRGGSTVRVRLSGAPDRVLPLWTLTGTFLGDPAHVRSEAVPSKAEASVVGFPAGRVRVTVRFAGEAAFRLDRVVDLDGIHDVTLDLASR